MTKPEDKAITKIVTLLTRYGFELKGADLSVLIDKWLKAYSVPWIRLAILEALYQGRYKAISVEQILILWKRRGQLTFHFSHEFERLICYDLLTDYPIVQHSTPQQVRPAEISWEKSDEFESNIAKEIKISPISSLLSESPEMSSLSDPVVPFKNELSNNQDEETQPIVSDGLAPRVLPHRSIHEFRPLRDHSQLYNKLRAVVYQGLSEESEEQSF